MKHKNNPLFTYTPRLELLPECCNEYGQIVYTRGPFFGGRAKVFRIYCEICKEQRDIIRWSK